MNCSKLFVLASPTLKLSVKTCIERGEWVFVTDIII